MAKEGPYEIVSIEELRSMKKQLADLKKKTSAFESNDTSIGEISKSMGDMLEIFKIAGEHIKNEDVGSSHDLGKKLDKIIEQNQTIAEALVSVNDMITDDVDKLLLRIDKAEKAMLAVREEPVEKLREPPKAPEPTPEPMPLSSLSSKPEPMTAPEPMGAPMGPPPGNMSPPMSGPEPMGRPMPPPNPPMGQPMGGPGPMNMPPPGPPPGMPGPGMQPMPPPMGGPEPMPGDMGGLPEMPPLDMEPKKKGFFSKIFHRK